MTRMQKTLLITALVSLVPVTLSANSISVTATAAMGDSSSSACGVPGVGCGLEVDYTGAASLAYVQSNHMNNETAIRLEYIIDPGPGVGGADEHLTMDATKTVRNIVLFQDFTPGTGVKVVLFLARNATNTSWRMQCYVRQDTTGFVTCGGGYLTGSTPSLGSATKVVFEWGAASAPGANDGYVRATRTLMSPGASTVTIFEKTNLDNDTHRLNIMRVGSPSTAEGGNPEGTLYLDEFVLSRM